MNKILLTIFGLIIGIILISYFYVSFLMPKKQTPNQTPPVFQPSPTIKISPTISSQPTQTTTPTPTAKVIPSSRFQIISVNPKENLDQEYNPITDIEFLFNEEIDLKTISWSVLPKVETNFKMAAPNKLIISPRKWWEPGITTITLSDKMSSTKGTSLEQPFIYKINTAWPKNPVDDRGI